MSADLPVPAAGERPPFRSRAVRIARAWLPPLLLLAAFCLAVFRFDLVEGLLGVRTKGLLVSRFPLWELAVQHLALVGASTAIALVAALGLGITAVQPFGAGMRPLLVAAGSLAETFPSAAILALAVPFVGYGFEPTFIALFLYGMLPVLHNTIAGIEGVPAATVDAARGMGMSGLQVLLRVQLPLAAPVIVAGLRTSIVANIGAATLGAAVGAGGLGMPIISGIRSFDTALVLRGAVPVALLALFADALLRRLERRGTRG
jgi:osmoprotectant transport system permease protein